MIETKHLRLYKHSRDLVYKANSTGIGYIEATDDGVQRWFPPRNPGYYASYILKEIIELLDELNKDVQDPPDAPS